MNTKDFRSKIAVSYVDINLLKPSDYNPRLWDNSAKAGLVESIKRFGLLEPLLINGAVNRKNVIIGGHFRLEVAKSLGYKKVPVVYVNVPSLEKEKELNLRLNRNTGDWDLELLKDFDIDLLLNVGFDDSDLSHIWDENLGVEDDDFDLEKEITKIEVPKTKLGDIVQLGLHRLVCGDAQDAKTISLLMKEAKASMLYLDPPYNIALDYSNGISTKGKYGGKTNDAKPDGQYGQFLTTAIKTAISHSCADVHVFCWCDENYIWLIQRLYSELGISPKRVCLWIKNNHNMTPQVAFNKVFEPVVYGTIGKPYISESVKNLNEVINKEIGTGNRTIDDILDLYNIWLVKRIAAQEYEHPTEKPPSLHEKPLRRCTKPGDVVIDLFAGSGSTLIACEQLKRRAYLCEIEPIFCDLIIRRYEKLTGKEAKYVGKVG